MNTNANNRISDPEKIDHLDVIELIGQIDQFIVKDPEEVIVPDLNNDGLPNWVF